MRSIFGSNNLGRPGILYDLAEGIMTPGIGKRLQFDSYEFWWMVWIQYISAKQL